MTHPAFDLFPPEGFDWTGLLRQWVPGDPYQPEGPDGAFTRRYYGTKAAIARWLKPTTVVEIGVRAGYSALAFWRGHPFVYFQGYDADVGSWGGVSGYATEARERLARLDLTAWSLDLLDTQVLTTPPPAMCGADLFHVDGDHSFAGALHDLVLALDSEARFVVVDDYDFCPPVRDAADLVCRARGLRARYVSDGGYRGNLVIANERIPFPEVTE